MLNERTPTRIHTEFCSALLCAVLLCWAVHFRYSVFVIMIN